LDRTLGVALIGAGQISAVHAAGYREAADYCSIVAVCDTREEVARRTADEYGAAAYTNYADALLDPRVDVLDVTLPHHLHYEVAAAGLQAGKHVLVEKPMAVRSSECRELIDLARSNGVTLTVAENTRFVEAYIAAKAVLDSKVLGEPRMIRTFIYGSEVERLREGSWIGNKDAAGGGMIMDAGAHSFYLLRWLFGDIASLRALGATLVRDGHVEDNAIVLGRLTQGALFWCELTETAEIPWGERLEIYGSKGTLIADQLLDPPVVHYRGADDFTGVPLPTVAHDLRDWKAKSIRAEVRDFVVAISEHRSPSVDPEDGLYAVLVAEKAYQSLEAAASEVLL